MEPQSSKHQAQGHILECQPTGNEAALAQKRNTVMIPIFPGEENEARRRYTPSHKVTQHVSGSQD